LKKLLISTSKETIDKPLDNPWNAYLLRISGTLINFSLLTSECVR